MSSSKLLPDNILMMLVLLSCVLSFPRSESTNISRCKLRQYTHKVMQTDMTGRRCWDDVKIKSCTGFCLTYEISDWQFPYKESHHPVCVHNDRRHASVKLSNCDPNVEPGTEVYHYIEATNCKCQVCSSEDTSCEWLPPDSSLLGELILKDEIGEELNLNNFLKDT